MTDRPHPAPWRPGRDLSGALVFGALSVLVCVIGGAATASSVGDWYAALAKPSFNPPNAVFGPVWTILYIAMAVAGWRVWRRRGWAGARMALTLYGLQLVLNLGWSLLFFGLRQIGPAVIEVLVLLAAVVATGAAFWRHDRIAGLLFAPYAAWTGFASALTFAIWRLN